MVVVLPEDDPALHKGVQEVANSIAVRRAGIEQRLHLRAVGESDGRAGCVERELVQEIASELARVCGQDRFQFADVLKATSISQLPGGIDRFGKRVGEVVSRSVDPRDTIALLDAAISRAPTAEDVEVLQRESDRIEPRMASGTARRLRM